MRVGLTAPLFQPLAGRTRARTTRIRIPDATTGEAQGFEAFAARGTFISGAFLPGSPFASGWRAERGALLDVGPHIIDLAVEALGPVASV